jgi:hypothetical protein
MSLPKIDLPIYELKLPSNGQEVKVRPFIVKEEKLLLMAAESGDTDEIIRTTKQVINNCLIDKVDIDNLPFFDVDFLFIALRAKSVGEAIDMQFTCNIVNDGEKCGNVFDAPIDISNTKVIKDDSIQNTIALSNNVSVKMRYPGYSIMKTLNDNEGVFDSKIKIIAHCIEMIVEGEKVFSRKDYTMKELVEFVEGLSEVQFKKLENFIDNFPYFVVEVESKCTKCGYDHRLEYRDFTAFFQ